MMNPIWLRTFCTLAETGHFTRTAEQLHMTQSGVSQHVRKLENALSRELLIREGKRFSLSDAGEKLYRQGREILQSLGELESAIRDDSAYAGSVRIATPGSIGLRLYRHLLSVQQRHPGMTIEHRFAPNDDVERLLLERRIDIGLMTRPAESPDLGSRALAEEELQLVTPAALPDPDWHSLMSLGFVDHPDGSHHASLLLGANFTEFRHVSQFPRAGFCNQIMLIAEPVALGLGFTVLPAHAIAAFREPERLSVHRLPRPVRETLYQIQHMQGPAPARLSTIISEIESCVAQLKAGSGQGTIY